MLENFICARNLSLAVHDIDLKRWALLKAKDIYFDDFVACDNWVYRFKCENNISSRKITKLVSKSLAEIDTTDQIKSFLDTTREAICKVSHIL